MHKEATSEEIAKVFKLDVKEVNDTLKEMEKQNRVYLREVDKLSSNPTKVTAEKHSKRS